MAPRPIKTVAACIVKALDEDERTYSRISPSIRHVVKTREANSVLEVRPVNRHVLADVDHYVRLEKIADAITRIAFYSSDESKQKMARALSACGPG